MPRDVYSIPTGPHERRHGPSGYLDYGNYKEWLRDEFQFRCVFCLHREKWERCGWRDFRIDHIIPQSVDERKIALYENLQYVCESCNEFKSDTVLPDPCKIDYSQFYRFEADGIVTPLGDVGDLFVEVLGLNEPHLVQYRAQWLQQLREFEEACKELDEPDLTDSLTRWFGYPADIPDLRRLRPRTNSKPDGKHHCYFVRLQDTAFPHLY